MPEDNPKEVSVNPDRLRAYGGWLMTKWSDVDLLQGHVLSMKITPGVMTGSTELRNRFNGQRQALADIITNLSGMLYQTGLDLTNLANIYQTTEDLQKDDAARLQKTIDDINKYYSGASAVLPIEAPDMPA